ncbi:MAG TPA: VWA domain-containing protein [Gammaproteobacteria bacterium]
MKRKRREVDTMSMSFLDVMSSGLGSMVLLLLVIKITEPIRLEESTLELEALLTQYNQQLAEIVGETEDVTRERADIEDDAKLDEQQLAQLERELARIRAIVLEHEDEAAVSQEITDQLNQAKQSLTEEMRRLFANNRPKPQDYKVGGIPVDSEYIIFLIDTSGSMKQYEWDRVQQQLQETLDVYPTVKGIQVLNDEGTHLFASYRGEWMPDTPARRQLIVEAVRGWNSFSDSSPREGILAAIDQYYDPEKKISLYVYSDDLSRGSISAIVREIDRRNAIDAEGNKRVRIHAVAFPVYYDVTGQLLTAANFMILMRAICQRNGGTLVALPSRRAD